MQKFIRITHDNVHNMTKGHQYPINGNNMVIDDIGHPRFAESLLDKKWAVEGVYGEMVNNRTKDVDPNGVDQHAPGAKLDSGKNRLALVLGGFANALEGVGEVGTFGAAKYSDNGWQEVEEGKSRYMDACFRHLLKHLKGIELDDESELDHLYHAAWNILAVIELNKLEK